MCFLHRCSTWKRQSSTCTSALPSQPIYGLSIIWRYCIFSESLAIRYSIFRYHHGRFTDFDINQYFTGNRDARALQVATSREDTMADNVCQDYFMSNTDLTGIGVRVAFYLQVGLLGSNRPTFLIRASAQIYLVVSSINLLVPRRHHRSLLDAHMHEYRPYVCSSMIRSYKRPTIMLQYDTSRKSRMVLIFPNFSGKSLTFLLSLLGLRIPLSISYSRTQASLFELPDDAIRSSKGSLLSGCGYLELWRYTFGIVIFDDISS